MEVLQVSTENSGNIIVGEKAPNFSLKNQDGDLVELKTFLGKYVVIFFYPKDNTPGCTKESCGFRDAFDEFGELNAVIFGISPDEEASHRKFIADFNLPYNLLCDPQKEVMQQYGAWGEKTMYGVKRMGTIRSTVLIDPEGRVVKHWRRVQKAADHPAAVLKHLEGVLPQISEA